MPLDYNLGTEVKKQRNVYVLQMGDDYFAISMRLLLNLNKVLSCRQGLFSPSEKGLKAATVFLSASLPPGLVLQGHTAQTRNSSGVLYPDKPLLRTLGDNRGTKDN